MILKYRTILLFIAALIIMGLEACNKEFDDIGPNPQPAAPPTGATLNTLINNDASFSIFRAAIAKAGMGSIIGDSTSNFTIFAPDNNAFIASSIPSVAVINNNTLFDTATVRSIVRYHVVPQILTVDKIPETFPNLQYPTLLNPAPTLSALLRLTTFPSKRGSSMWVNNIPITSAPIQASNGLIYKVAALVAPPSKSLSELITADTVSFFRAALARADVGKTTIEDQSFTEILKSIGANLTVFVPTNQAFRNFLVSMGLPPAEATFAALPVTTVRGIIVYHILGARAFSVNMPTVAARIPTLLNGGVPAHPGLTVQAGFTGPFVTSFRATGAANGGVASNVVVQDLHATNGVYHKIDRVLLPQ
ncbi:MAG TPA: fasciclin domain-containing protein [Chitinophagaceae bacterium]|jgi:uncharacterized surface protein with fasciclin (FAS1) repeats|nr:fasciclin domain-containing protein [Chitinophagaceae bacterium]